MLKVALFGLGLILIIVGGNVFVDSSVRLAERLRIPKLIIGATVVSLATTLPELIVSVLATKGGSYEMASGNAIGSVVVNTGFILAIALIAAPQEGNCKGKAALLIVAEIITLIFSLSGKLGAIASLPLFATCIVFMWLNVKEGLNEEQSDKNKGLAFTIVSFALGITCLIFGSRLLVRQGSALAAALGVPESIIAVTIVAMGTSLPELVTSITALIKKQGSLSLGNILGANIMDIAFIMPICALVGGGLIISKQTLILDLPFCLLLSLIAFLPKKRTRLIGFILLALYGVYLALLLTFFL